MTLIRRVKIRERGAMPWMPKRQFNKLSKAAWMFPATEQHRVGTPKRFTPAHALEARYALRKGQGLTRGSKRFKRSYYGRKLKSRFGGGTGVANPLEYSGDAKLGSKIVNISTTKSGAKMRYKGVRVFNFRHPKSRIRMNEEFRRILPSEADMIAQNYDTAIDKQIDGVTKTKTTVIS